jgi:hypothetical protein
MKYDLKDKTFNHWTVLEESTKRGEYRTWLCRCQCGLVKSVYQKHLLSGKSRGCYCCAGKRYRDDIKDKCGRISNTFWYILVRDAKRRRLALEITKWDLDELYVHQGGLCSLSGVPISLPLSSLDCRKCNYTASLDRIDSSKGYIKGNIQWVHKHVNKMKMDFAQDYFVDFCCMIANVQKNHRISENLIGGL